MTATSNYSAPSKNCFIRYHGYYFLSSVVIILFLIFIFLGVSTFDYRRQFFERDPTFSNYDTNGEIVPDHMLVGLSLGVSIASIVVFTLIHHLVNSPNLQKNPTNFFLIFLEHLYLALIAFLTAYIVTGLITEILKDLFSRPRPGFFYYCNYQGYRDGIKAGNLTQYYALTDPTRLGNEDYCWDSKGKIDAMKSFPSGHSSLTFCGMSFISFYLLQLTYFNHKLIGNNGSTSWLSPYANFIIVRMLCFIPYILSTWVAVSRIIDYKHTELDVTVGGSIGILCSYFFTKQLKFYLYNSYNPCLTLTYPDGKDGNGQSIIPKKTDEEQPNDPDAGGEEGRMVDGYGSVDQRDPEEAGKGEESA